MKLGISVKWLSCWSLSPEQHCSIPSEWVFSCIALVGDTVFHVGSVWQGVLRPFSPAFAVVTPSKVPAKYLFQIPWFVLFIYFLLLLVSEWSLRLPIYVKWESKLFRRFWTLWTHQRHQTKYWSWCGKITSFKDWLNYSTVNYKI